MTKSALISLAALILNDGAAAFGVQSSHSVDVARAPSRLAYKQGHYDDEYISGSSDGWTKGSSPQEASVSFVNGTYHVVMYDDFHVIREEDRPPRDTSSKAVEQPPAAIEPSSSKPVKKFITPIQMMKLVPKVEPIVNSSVFFVAPAVDYETDKKSSEVPPKNTVKNNGMKEKWSPRKKWGTAPFSTASFLESLSPTNNDVQQDDENKSLMASLRNQQAQIRAQREESTLQAMRDAMRRTSPKEVIEARIAEAEESRKLKEVERLEKLYNSLNNSTKTSS
eukprot:CCRYP_017567-RA/>CCRYP_017567-RA protein AED:0.34 eAED:0.34 QI:0/-1/0/1/-1/1/1/0/279